jgi:hypothetical protein
MGATSVTGVGNGSAEGLNKGPGNNRTIYTTVNGPHVVAAGEVYSDGCWQVQVDVPGLTETPDKYVVLVTQSDWSDSDGRGNRPPHIHKYDIYGNSQYNVITGEGSGPDENTWYTMAGFVLHPADDDYADICCDFGRKFGWVIVRAGGAFSFDDCY